MMEELDRFYQSRVGQAAKIVLARAIYSYWPLPPSSRILGVGCVSPFVPHLWGASECVWDHARTRDLITMRDNSVSHMLLAHVFEQNDTVSSLFAQAARILNGMHGQMLLIMPNQRGLWANSDTPFARQYGMLKRMIVKHLVEQGLYVRAMRPVLLAPPGRLSLSVEASGRYLWSSVAGAWVFDIVRIDYARHRMRHMRLPRAHLNPSPRPIIGVGGSAYHDGAQKPPSRQVC